jgi:hypothetical protein
MRFRLFPVYYATDADATGGSGGEAAQGTVDPTQGTGIPQGQGEPQGTGFNWGLFPNVPEDRRGELEPHLRTVQGHVTKLEQQLAPVRPLLEAGYNPNQIQGLVRFAQDFGQNPMGAWLNMAQHLQQAGVLHNDLDLETVARVAAGESIEDDGSETQMQGLEGLPPQVSQTIQGLQQQIQEQQRMLQELTDSRQQEQVQAQQRTQQAMLQRTLGNMREALQAEKYPGDLATDDRLVSAIYQARGDAQRAVRTLIDERSAMLKGFTQANQEAQPGGQLRVTGTPPGPQQTPRRNGDSWDKARAGATQFLKQNNEARAQGT